MSISWYCTTFLTNSFSSCWYFPQINEKFWHVGSTRGKARWSTVQQEWLKVLNAKNWSCLPFNITCNYPATGENWQKADSATVSSTIRWHWAMSAWSSNWIYIQLADLLADSWLWAFALAVCDGPTINRKCETAHHVFSVALICKLEASFSSQVRCHTKCLLFPHSRNFSWGLLCLHHPTTLCKYMDILIENSQSVDSSLWSFRYAPMQYPPPQSGH